MRYFMASRRALVVLVILSSLCVVNFSRIAFTHAAATNPAYVALNGSYVSAPLGAKLIRPHAAHALLTITAVLQPLNNMSLDSLMAELYDIHSPRYHHWLAQGEFNARFAQSAARIAQVRSFMQAAGLKVVASPSPFLLRATGTTTQIELALHTHINDYVAANGHAFFQNDSRVLVPASLGSTVSAIAGLTNTVRLHTNYVTTLEAAHKAGKTIPSYGAAPGKSGFTPSQLAGIYDTNGAYQLGNKGKGKGATLAVFELSGYTSADIITYEHKFFGSAQHVSVVNVNVDGGPVTPQCPAGDQCGPFGECANGCNSADYSGDIEVEADIETQIAIAPSIDRILVYNAPNDSHGITPIDEYFRIAKDNRATAISSSWGLCEQDAGIAILRAESIAFKQMAMQGQSMFAAAGDTGAFDCLRGSGVGAVAVDDPSSQPYVTSVGGTSFGTFDPRSNLHPSYPKGFETVWNVLNRCNGTVKGLSNCTSYGAGGGGVSAFWSKPAYQYGPGVISSFSQKGPYCSLAAVGQYCREIPDVSANADENTPYTEYCTGDPQTNSACGAFSRKQAPPGWFGIGGTSLSSPVWSAIIALWASIHGKRFGNANNGLYKLLRTDNSYSHFFHDITGVNQTENNNGYYPVTVSYDLATGSGTPCISGLALSKP